MKDDFIIDENIVINAWRGTNAQDQRAHSERIFLNAFIPSDKKLLSTINIQSKYRQLENVQLKNKKYEDVGIKKWFLDRLLDSEKCPIIDGLKIPKYKHVKDDDAEFVYLAIQDGQLGLQIGQPNEKVNMAIQVHGINGMQTARQMQEQ